MARRNGRQVQRRRPDRLHAGLLVAGSTATTNETDARDCAPGLTFVCRGQVAVTLWIIPASRRPRFDALSFGDAAAAFILSPAKSLSEMGRAVCNDFVDATLAALFSATVVYGFN
jgi:hypothetical protein